MRKISVCGNQIILANDVCQDGHDAHQFIPQMRNICENIKLSDETKISVDCGYSDGINIKYAEDNDIDLYVPSRAQAQKFDGKEETLNHDNYQYDWKNDIIIVDENKFNHSGSYTRKDGKQILTYYCKELKKKKDVPYFFRERLRMKEKMELPESKKVYGRRKVTVEPVYGNIKANFGLREFTLRGLEKVKIELNLVSIAHNLKKIWKLSGKVWC